MRTNKFSLLLLNLALFFPGARMFSQCQSAAGSWTSTYNYNWQLTQDGNGNITGTVDVSADGCSTSVWPVAGTFQGGGRFSVTGTNPSPDGDICVVSFDWNGSINVPGCNTGGGTWDNSGGTSGSWTWTKPCDIPTGETTSFDGWDTVLPTVGDWTQSLMPSTINFGGRTVTEQDPGGGGPDTCWFSGSNVAQTTSISGGSWTVDGSNHWGADDPDGVGWPPDAVTYYRDEGREPCGTTFPQQMVIDCSDGTPTYITNTLSMDITSTTVSSSRAGNSQSKNWP